MKTIVRFLILLVLSISSACDAKTENITDNSLTKNITDNSLQTQSPAKQEEPVLDQWYKKCVVNKNKESICSVYRNTTLENSKNVIVHSKVFYLKKQLVATFRLPFGVFIPSGVAIKIDDEEQIKFSMSTCLADGCYASLKVDDDLLNQFKSGELMKIGFKNLDKTTLAFNVSLKGFSVAFDSL